MYKPQAVEDEAGISQVWGTVDGAIVVPPYEVALGAPLVINVLAVVTSDATAAHTLRLVAELKKPSGLTALSETLTSTDPISPGGNRVFSLPAVTVDEQGPWILNLTLADDTDPTIEFQTLSGTIVVGTFPEAQDVTVQMGEMINTFAPFMVLAMIVPMFAD